MTCVSKRSAFNVQAPSHAMATSKPYRVLTVSVPIEVLRGVEPTVAITHMAILWWHPTI